MDLLVKLTTFLLLCSCAKLAYVSNQAIGQLSLELKGIDNQKILKSSKYKEEDKNKIKDIIRYKNFFYDYFQREPTAIYDETSFLDSEAVTYLVIASRFDEVKALKTSFPIVGSFPYLGFFNKEHALKYQKKRIEQEYYTYMRPVYAYSTLDKLFFKDNILSSFFHYPEIELCELIFHELTHTIFFVKDDVAFNESFAEYLGRELMFEYFRFSSDKIEAIQRKREKTRKLYKKVNELALLYKETLDKLKIQTKSEADIHLNNYMQKTFTPEIKKTCSELKMRKCWPLKKAWNNARFAAFLTYSEKQNIVDQIRRAKKLDLKSLLLYLEKEYDSFNGKGRFSDFLKERI